LEAVELPADLVNAVARREVLLVVGAGASIAVCGDPDSPVSWKGLLHDGLRYTAEQNLLSAEAAQNGTALLRSGFFDATASLINDALQGSRGDWLMSAFNELETEDGRIRLYDAIASIQPSSLITTNYDTLLGSYLERAPISWTSQGFATALNLPEALRNTVLHVHGCYLESDSVVLDAADYERLSRSSAMEALQTAAATRPLLFVGCGPDGLRDPHFRRLWDWLGDVTTRQHYALLPKSVDSKAMRAVSGNHLRFILYDGDEDDSYAALPLVLEQLADEASLETGQLQDVGRVAVEALGKVVDEIRIAVLTARGFEALVPEALPPIESLEENQQERLHRLLAQQTRGADLCIVPLPVTRKDADSICMASDVHTLVPLEEGGMLLGSPEGEPEIFEDSVVEVDFSDGPPKACRPASPGHQQRVLR